ncbi:MAG TPA: hypothetical protein VNI78_11500 [Vicinamibacterales bacterium]|nr:hypothetical protein [Vicinamibacterales bacterium]
MVAWLLLLAPALLLALTPILSARQAGTSQARQRIVDQPELIGTWRLNPAKSKYSPGPPPKSETRTYTRDAEGITGVIHRVYADGREETIEYRADFDQEYPVKGTEAYDAVILKRIDARTAEAVLSHAGRVFGYARRVIASDGRTMTITFRRDPPSSVHNVAVYDKEADGR